jgi:hypothetical protein
MTDTTEEINNYNKAISSINLYDNSSGYTLYNLVKKGFTNYQEDIKYIYDVNQKIQQMNSNNKITNELTKEESKKKRHIESNTYYIKKYHKEIGLIKTIIFFSCLGLLGFMLSHYGIFSENFLVIYMGILLSFLFVKVFYDLWDIYIRDERNFDEYDFSVYSKGVEDATKESDLPQATIIKTNKCKDKKNKNLLF